MGSESSPGGANPPEIDPKALGSRHKSLVGWWSHPKGPMAPHKKIPKENKMKREKSEVGRKRRTPPSQTELEEESSSSLGECTLEALCLKASPPHPSYIYWWFRADLSHNFVTCNSNLYHVVLPRDRISAELGRSPVGVDDH